MWGWGEVGMKMMELMLYCGGVRMEMREFKWGWGGVGM